MSRFLMFVFGALLLVTDVLLLIGIFAVSYRLRLQVEPRAGFTMPPLQSYHELLALLILGTIGMIAVANLYAPRRGVSRIDLFYTVFICVSAGMLIGLGVSAIMFKGIDYPRWVLVWTWMAASVLLWLSRVLLHSAMSILRSLGVDQLRLVIVGAGEAGRIVYDRIAEWAGLGYTVVGFLEDDPERSIPTDMALLGPPSALPQVVSEYNIDEVIFASPSISHKQMLALVDACGKRRINVKVFPDAFQIMSSEVSVTELGGLPLLSVRDIALRGWNLTIKRAMDLLISAVVLVLMSPIMMGAALLIKLTSMRGPVFYTQARVGLDGKPFELIKFRSMRPDAEDDSGPIWAKAGDGRTTWLGRFMRRYSFDELPQLVNVLMGEMSLVGPRPERPFFVEQFKQIIPRYEERHREKAGMTGWAQVNGLRGNTSIEERTKYDIYYVENWSPLFDIKILLRTLFIVFKGGNAY